VAILVASGQVEQPAPGAMFLGELSLDGRLRHTHGVLPMVATARAAGPKCVCVPAEDAAEAALLEGLEVVPTLSLADLVAHLRSDIVLPPAAGSDLRSDDWPEDVLDVTEVRGREHAKWALEIGAASATGSERGRGPPGLCPRRGPRGDPPPVSELLWTS